MRFRPRMAALALVLALGPLPSLAQEDLSLGQVRSPVLTIDPDRLLAETRFGRRMNEEIRAREVALAAENERLEEQLTAEEQNLTQRRPGMEVEAFRAEAEAFDQRVQRIRAEQDAKQRDLQAADSSLRVEFLNAVSPILAGLMIDSGAAVILERRQVFLGVGLVEITDEAIAAIDAQIGDGTAPPDPDPNTGPDTDPDTDPDGAEAPVGAEGDLAPEGQDGGGSPGGAEPSLTPAPSPAETPGALPAEPSGD